MKDEIKLIIGLLAVGGGGFLAWKLYLKYKNDKTKDESKNLSDNATKTSLLYYSLFGGSKVFNQTVFTNLFVEANEIMTIAYQMESWSKTLDKFSEMYNRDLNAVIQDYLSTDEYRSFIDYVSKKGIQALNVYTKSNCNAFLDKELTRIAKQYNQGSYLGVYVPSNIVVNSKLVSTIKIKLGLNTYIYFKMSDVTIK